VPGDHRESLAAGHRQGAVQEPSDVPEVLQDRTGEDGRAVLGYERANSPTACSSASRAAWPTEEASSTRASSHGSASAASSSRAASSLNSSARGRPRGPGEQVAVEVAGLLVVVDPPADHGDQTLGPWKGVVGAARMAAQFRTSRVRDQPSSLRTARRVLLPLPAMPCSSRYIVIGRPV
jgi:hypothetical protein